MRLLGRKPNNPLIVTVSSSKLGTYKESGDWATFGGLTAEGVKKQWIKVATQKGSPRTGSLNADILRLMRAPDALVTFHK